MANEPEPPQPLQPFQPPADRELYIPSLAVLVSTALYLQPVFGREGGIKPMLEDAAKISDWLRAT